MDEKQESEIAELKKRVSELEWFRLSVITLVKEISEALKSDGNGQKPT